MTSTARVCRVGDPDLSFAECTPRLSMYWIRHFEHLALGLDTSMS